MVESTITETMIGRFRDHLISEERSPATVEKYVRDVHVFAEFIDTRELNKELVIKYKNHLVERYAPISVNSILAALNKFLKGLGRYDCVVKTLRIQRQSFRNRERELSREEYLRILETAKRKGKDRLLMLMQTICSTGIRVSELKFITVEAICSGQAVVSLKGKTRIVLLPSGLCRELKKYVKKQKIGQGSIFITKNGKSLDRSNILHDMKSLCAEAGVDRKKVFPHNLRHLFACLFYKASKDISRLADILGHSSINTTRIYTCTSGREQRIQIDKLGLIIKNTA